MDCPRCGKANPGASWFCANCGAPLGDLNVADSGARRPLPPLVRWSLIASASLLMVIALVALGAVALRFSRDRGDPLAGGGPTSTTDAVATLGTSEAAVVRTEAVPPTTTPSRIVTPVPTPRPRPEAPVWTLRRVERPPTIDGSLDDWRAQSTNIEAVVFGDEYWSGPEDLSGRAFAGWDEQALYIGVQVIDDLFSQPATGDRLYLGDSLEVQIDADLEGDWAAEQYNGDDWQIGLSPGDFGDKPPEAYIWRPVATAAEGVELGARRLENGYILEAAIPWALVGVDPMRVRGVGLALNISDNDEPTPAQLTMVSSSPVRSWSDPRSFGTVVLVLDR